MGTPEALLVLQEVRRLGTLALARECRLYRKVPQELARTNAAGRTTNPTIAPQCSPSASTPGGLALGRANSTSRITSSVHLFESAQRRYREQQTNEQPVDRAQGNPRHRKAAQPTLPHLPDTQ